MKSTISFKSWDSALFNLDSMRTALQVQRDNVSGSETAKIDAKINEVEELLGKMHFGRVTRKEWARIQGLVAERRMQRYTSCLNSGMDESVAAGAFDD